MKSRLGGELGTINARTLSVVTRCEKVAPKRGSDCRVTPDKAV